MKKQRIDQLLVDRDLAEDLDEARRWIMAGLVLVEDQRIDKPGTLIKTDSHLRIKRKAPYASRGGFKLAGALDHFPVAVDNRIALDLGASTGGFTDCLLQRGAARVYAVDVGTNQLVWHLRTDPRVVVLEKTHAKALNRKLVPDPISLLVADVSFTSLTYVLPPVLPLLAPEAEGICLFKPQFELPRDQVGQGGIVADERGRQALDEMLVWLAEQGIETRDQIKSPVKGRDGNQEYLIWMRFGGRSATS